MLALALALGLALGLALALAQVLALALALALAPALSMSLPLKEERAYAAFDEIEGLRDMEMEGAPPSLSLILSQEARGHTVCWLSKMHDQKAELTAKGLIQSHVLIPRSQSVPRPDSTLSISPTS